MCTKVVSDIESMVSPELSVCDRFIWVRMCYFQSLWQSTLVLEQNQVMI